jgi:hypothetical protein
MFVTAQDLAEAQALQEANMPDVCEIRFHDRIEFTDGVEATVQGDVAVTYQGTPSIPCRIGVAGGDIAGVRIDTVGEQRIPTRTVVVTVPASVAGVVPDTMLVKVTVARDSQLTGRRLPIVGAAGSSFPTARRLVCLSPEG